jgi:hypothetical protein
MEITIDVIESTTAVRNIRLNESDEGSDSVKPLILIAVWFVCIYIEARAGPIELPTILSILLIPIVTPADSLGEARIIIFIAPTAASDSPADNTAKPVEISVSDK